VTKNSKLLGITVRGSRSKGKFIVVDLPSEAAVTKFKHVNACPVGDPGKFALKLLSVFFSPEELRRSNCTPAEGRDLLDPDSLLGIKSKNIQNDLFTNPVCCFSD
jgi:hypothetical protein